MSDPFGMLRPLIVYQNENYFTYESVDVSFPFTATCQMFIKYDMCTFKYKKYVEINNKKA